MFTVASLKDAEKDKEVDLRSLFWTACVYISSSLFLCTYTQLSKIKISNMKVSGMGLWLGRALGLCGRLLAQLPHTVGGPNLPLLWVWYWWLTAVYFSGDLPLTRWDLPTLKTPGRLSREVMSFSQGQPTVNDWLILRVKTWLPCLRAEKLRGVTYVPELPLGSGWG